MIDFEFVSPTKIIFGRNAEANTGDYTAKYGKNVLLLYGSERVKSGGLLGSITASLERNDIAYTELGGVQPNPRIGKVYEGVDICREKHIDFILAVGGGSVIDTAKAIAAGARYEGDVWDFYMNRCIAKDALPIGTVLTIAAAGSEASWATVIFNEEEGLKRAYHADILRPVFAVLNPELTLSVPEDQTAYGCADIFMHCFERYFTSVEHVELTDRLCEAVFKTVLDNSKKAICDPQNYDVRAEILWASVLANNDILTTGRIPDWATHNIGHEISARFGVAHGATVAIIGLAWMKYLYKRDIPRFAQFASRVMGVEPDFFDPEKTALCGIERLKCFFADMGLPVTLGELGIGEDAFDDMAEKCVKLGNVGRFAVLAKQDVKEIYRLAL